MGLRKSGNELSYTAKVDISQAIKAVDELKKRFDNLGLQNATEAQRAYNKTQIEFQNQLKKARLELAALKKEEQEIKNVRLKSAADIAEINKHLAKNRLEQQELRKAAKAAKEANKAASGSYKEAQERLKALGLEIRNTSGGFRSQSPELRAKIKEYNELNWINQCKMTPLHHSKKPPLAKSV